MTDEDRLRHLLSDPGWSLPAWPDAQARIRRAARRQRLTAASVGVVVTAVIVTAAVLPAVLTGRVSRPVAASHERDHVSPTAHPRPTRQPAIPPIGAAGFPASIYPAAARPRVATGELSLCPDPAGLEAPGPATPAAARMVLRKLGRGFASDLHVSDRAAWPLLASSWPSRGIRHVATAARSSVRYAGPLQPGRGAPADLYHVIVNRCGMRVASTTWVIIYGRTKVLTLDASMLFVTRRGHMLFYSAS